MHASAVSSSEERRIVVEQYGVEHVTSVLYLDLISPVLLFLDPVIGIEAAAFSVSRFSSSYILQSSIPSIMLFLKTSLVLLMVWTGICFNLDFMWRQSDHLRCLPTHAGIPVILSGLLPWFWGIWNHDVSFFPLFFLFFRLRIALSAAHTSEDIRRLVTALSGWIRFPALEQNYQIASKI